MIIHRLYKMMAAIAITAGFASREKDFLDTRIDTQQTQGTLNTNYNTLVLLAIAPYTSLRNEFTSLDNNLFAAVSDEAVQTNVSATVRLFNNGSWNAANNPDNYFGVYYGGIRSANYFLEQSGNYKTFLAMNRDTVSVNGKTGYTNDTLNMRWYRAEAHVLRAWFYFELVKRYGGVPLITRTLSINENTFLPRATYQQVINFIVSEIDTYKDSLQVNWKTSAFSGNDGRLSKGAALALKARTLLYAASPLNNSTNDVTKWQTAAAALNDVIVFAGGAGAYSLHNDYRNYFLQSNTLTSSETIWAIRYPANSIEAMNYPIATPGGMSGLTPTQDLVSEYEYKGIPIADKPYFNRDPRLFSSIVTNDTTWNNRKIDQSVGATDDMRRANASRTGYYLKKFMNDNLNLVQNQAVTHNWPVFRYGEVLLEYAEAMNEAYGPDNNNGYNMTAKTALNMVRGRNGVAMPAVTVAGKDAFRTAVKHERRVELAFENHRYWDLLRWKDAATVLNQPVSGVVVTKNATGLFTYTPYIVENRVFDASKMYLYPLPQSEVLNSQGVLQQNPNW